MKYKICLIMIASLSFFSIQAQAQEEYSAETKEYRSFIEKTEKDKQHTIVEVKDIDSMEAFERENAELSYEREDGIIGSTTNMRDFYNYKVITTDGSYYLYNKELCYINPYVKKLKIIKRNGWGFFLMPVDSPNIISEPQDCSAVKGISDKMTEKLNMALERRNN